MPHTFSRQQFLHEKRRLEVPNFMNLPNSFKLHKNKKIGDFHSDFQLSRRCWKNQPPHPSNIQKPRPIRVKEGSSLQLCLKALISCRLKSLCSNLFFASVPIITMPVSSSTSMLSSASIMINTCLITSSSRASRLKSLRVRHLKKNVVLN